MPGCGGKPRIAIEHTIPDVELEEADAQAHAARTGSTNNPLVTASIGYRSRLPNEAKAASGTLKKRGNANHRQSAGHQWAGLTKSRPLEGTAEAGVHQE
jgi:hypothetical protein